MKSWFLIYYNEDMERCTEHFELDSSISYPTKQLIESNLGIDIYNNWVMSEVKNS